MTVFAVLHGCTTLDELLMASRAKTQQRLLMSSDCSAVPSTSSHYSDITNLVQWHSTDQGLKDAALGKIILNLQIFHLHGGLLKSIKQNGTIVVLCCELAIDCLAPFAIGNPR